MIHASSWQIHLSLSHVFAKPFVWSEHCLTWRPFTAVQKMSLCRVLWDLVMLPETHAELHIPATYLRCFPAFGFHASPAANQARCHFNTFHNKKSKLFSSSSFAGLLPGKKFSLHAEADSVSCSFVCFLNFVMSQLLFLILTLKRHILHRAVCCEGRFESCSLFPTTSDLECFLNTFLSGAFLVCVWWQLNSFVQFDCVFLFLWHQSFCTQVWTCELEGESVFQEQQTELQKKKKKKGARELEGFIISVQCFLSQFHHPVWRGILPPRSPWVSERPHTNCACEYAQSSPHAHAHTCAHSYRCWQRS